MIVFWITGELYKLPCFLRRALTQTSLVELSSTAYEASTRLVVRQTSNECNTVLHAYDGIFQFLTVWPLANGSSDYW